MPEAKIQLKVAIFRFCNIGGIPDAAGSQNLSIEAAGWNSDPELHDRIVSVLHVPCDLSERLPIDIARSQAVKFCRDNDISVAFFVNGNVVPPSNFFKQAFMLIHEGIEANEDPRVVAAPCMTSYESCNLYQFKDEADHSGHAISALEAMPLDVASEQTGMKLLPCVGAQCIGYNVDAFNPLASPCFSLGCDYENFNVIYMDDVNCHRQMHEHGQMIHVLFDSWCSSTVYARLEKPTFEAIEQ